MLNYHPPRFDAWQSKNKSMKTKLPFPVTTVILSAVLLQFTAAKDALAQHFSGSPNYFRPASHLHLDALQPAATTTPTGFTPDQIRQAYGFDQLPGSIDGTGQTIAIVDAFGDRYATITTNTTIVHHKPVYTYTTNYTDVTQIDWNTFCNQFGLSTNGLSIVYPQGQGITSTNWALETAMDIQWAHTIAPGAQILLVVSRDNSWASMYAAVDFAVSNGANIVSMSFGNLEYTNELADDVHFNHPGVTFTAASGDSGESSACWYPAASPYVVGVGGTLLTNINGTWSETAWSGSGGGISLYESMPAFQSGWQQFPTSNMRSVPDVAYKGAPGPGVSTYMTIYGGWINVYGTSDGAPQWAALFALANSARTSGTLTNANSALYSVAATYIAPPAITANYFNDITSGTNGPDADDAALTGYDFVTGLGSPKANNLVPILTTY